MCKEDLTMDTVHRNVLSIDRDIRTSSKGRRGRRYAFNIVTFRIGETPVLPWHERRIHGLFWKNTMPHLGIPVTLYIKLEEYYREVFV
ncbi:hypothetical protein TNCV_2501441 [Trichonephila clavipes]|nr:hypothetical protein TNCV_2501441 [Trichonephila clavipes]